MGKLEISGPPKRLDHLTKFLIKLSSAGAMGGLTGFTLMGSEGVVIGIYISMPVYLGSELVGNATKFFPGNEDQLN